MKKKKEQGAIEKEKRKKLSIQPDTAYTAEELRKSNGEMRGLLEAQRRARQTFDALEKSLSKKINQTRMWMLAYIVWVVVYQ